MKGRQTGWRVHLLPRVLRTMGARPANTVLNLLSLLTGFSACVVSGRLHVKHVHGAGVWCSKLTFTTPVSSAIHPAFICLFSLPLRWCHTSGG